MAEAKTKSDAKKVKDSLKIVEDALREKGMTAGELTIFKMLVGKYITE